LDIEYQLEALKHDIQASKPVEELLRKIDLIEQYVMTVWIGSNTEAHTLLQRQIAAADRQIDRLVDALYGLTEAEIATVEGIWKKSTLTEYL
jgi:hypothetical protein